LETIHYLYTEDKEIFGELKYTSNIFSDYKKHFHTHFGLTLIEEGVLQINYDIDTQVTLDNSSIAIFNPRQIHRSEVISAQGYYVLFLNHEWCENIQEDFFFHQNILNSPIFYTKLKKIFVNVLKDHKRGIEAELKILIKELFIQYSSTQRKVEKEIIRKTKMYIASHSDELFGVEEVASSIGYAKSYLIRIFKKEVGITPQHYILNEKVNRAKDLLSYSETNSLSHISVNAGFFDQSHFNRNFKSHFGTSPKKYKKVNIIQD